MMKFNPHPAVKILYWCLVALFVQHVHGVLLLATLSLLMCVAVYLCASRLVSLLRRTRWILFTLTIVYAYAIPGSAIFPSLGVMSPTVEGLGEGAIQMGRLLGVLAGLAILLQKLSSSQLMSGLFSLVFPLKWLGVSRERFSVRLALTLQYAESSMRESAKDLQFSIRDAMTPDMTQTSNIALSRQSFLALDYILIGMGALILMEILR